MQCSKPDTKFCGWILSHLPPFARTFKHYRGRNLGYFSILHCTGCFKLDTPLCVFWQRHKLKTETESSCPKTWHECYLLKGGQFKMSNYFFLFAYNAANEHCLASEIVFRKKTRQFSTYWSSVWLFATNIYDFFFRIDDFSGKSDEFSTQNQDFF